MSYLITNDDWKPSLLDKTELEHYGVKGMKWGVRRSQRELDRAAGRTLEKGESRSKQIRKARVSVNRARDKQNRLEDKFYEKEAKKEIVEARTFDNSVAKKRLDKINGRENNTTPEQMEEARQASNKAHSEYRQAEAAFKKAQQDYEQHPKRAIAAKITYGEAALFSLLLTPAFGGGILAGAEVSSALVRRQQRRGAEEIKRQEKEQARRDAKADEFFKELMANPPKFDED